MANFLKKRVELKHCCWLLQCEMLDARALVLNVCFVRRKTENENTIGNHFSVCLSIF